MSELVELGRNIALLRKARHLTQEQAAELSHLSVHSFQRIERGYQNPTVDTLRRIADIFEIDSAVIGIFSRTDPMILSETQNLPRLQAQGGSALHVCRNIFYLREARCLTQKQLCSLSGVSLAYLREIEHSYANVSMQKLIHIASAFDMTLLQLRALSTPEAELLRMVYDARIAAGIFSEVKRYDL